MNFIEKGFSKVMNDNEAQYFIVLRGVIESVDNLSSMEVRKNPHSYNFRLSPSSSKYTDLLVSELIKFHNMLNIHINLSKSIKSTGSLVFEINLFD